MKRSLALIIAIVTVFAFTACDGNDTGIKGGAYTARHTHLFPYAAIYTDYDYSVVIDGAKAELIQYTYDSETNDDGAFTATQITRMTGSVKLEDGYYVVTVKKLYNSVKVNGAGAKAYKDEMIAMANEQIEQLDPETENYKEYKQRYEMIIELYGGKEIDATEMSLGEFNSVAYKVKLDDAHGKITELLMLAEGNLMGGYKFEYGENGVMTGSTEYDNDNDLWEVEYRENGTPSFFKYTTENEVMNFACDENGNVTEIAED